MYKAAVILALVGVASAGLVADYHVGSTAENTVRGFGGLSSLSSQVRTVNGAYSTSTAYKNKATNSAVFAPAPVAYAAPAPVAYAQPAIAAPVAYAQPALPVARAIASPLVAKAAVPTALGVAYSPALGVAGVAHSFFDGIGVHYAF